MDWETYWKSRWQQNISAASEDAYISHYESDLGRSARERQLEYLADEELINFIGAKASDVVLDAGCGAGRVVFLMHSTVNRMIGMDYSDSAIERLQGRIRSKEITNVQVVVGPVTDIPLQDCSVDRVLCMSVLQFLGDREVRKALEEFKRVLTENGSLVLHVKNISSVYLLTLWAAKRIKLMLHKQTKLEYLRSFRWYINILTASGFDILDYNSLNLLMMEMMPKRMILFLRELELRNHNRAFFRSGFIRRHGSELKIKAGVNKTK